MRRADVAQRGEEEDVGDGDTGMCANNGKRHFDAWISLGAGGRGAVMEGWEGGGR